MGDRPSSLARSRQQTALPQEQLFDTHPEVSLDFEIVRQAARQKYTRPFLILDTAIVRDKLRRFRAAMPRVRPHYAVKANPDRRVLKAIIEKYNGGPVGLSTIAASISEEPDTIMDVVEPYLLQLGFLDRTPQGRVATKLAYNHLGVAYPETGEQPRLL